MSEDPEVAALTDEEFLAHIRQHGTVIAPRKPRKPLSRRQQRKLERRAAKFVHDASVYNTPST